MSTGMLRRLTNCRLSFIIIIITSLTVCGWERIAVSRDATRLRS